MSHNSSVQSRNQKGKNWKAKQKINKYIISLLKFGLFEKHSKFEKNHPHGFDKPADLQSKRQIHKGMSINDSPPK